MTTDDEPLLLTALSLTKAARGDWLRANLLGAMATELAWSGHGAAARRVARVVIATLLEARGDAVSATVLPGPTERVGVATGPLAGDLRHLVQSRLSDHAQKWAEALIARIDRGAGAGERPPLDLGCAEDDMSGIRSPGDLLRTALQPPPE